MLTLEPGVIFGIATGAGSVVRAIWSYVKLKSGTPDMKWDWLKFFGELAPAFVIGFIAGFALSGEVTVGNVILAFFGGAGFSSLQTRLFR